MKYLFYILFVCTTLPFFAQESIRFDPEVKFHQDSIKHWARDLMEGIQNGHPGFYRYTSKERFDVIIDSTLQTINDSISTLGYYRKLKPLIAQIGCLHTTVALPDAYYEMITDSATFLPLEVFIDQDASVFITKIHGDNTVVPVKAELLSIDGVPIRHIVKKLQVAIPSDGYNTTEKTLALNLRFSPWYHTMIGGSDSFTINTRFNGKTQDFIVNGVTSDVFPTEESVVPSDTEQLGFEIKDGIGVLKIQTFAKTTINNNGQRFKKFIKNVFQRLDDEHIDNLIIDLRYNTGGTDGNAAFLASHFFDTTFRYWDRIEVTEDIAGQVSKGIQKVFYSKPEKGDSLYLWKGALLTKEFNYYKPQKPAKNNYKGQTFILTNGFCMSSAADVIAILSHKENVMIVGEESGGGYQGNTSGLMPQVTLYGGIIVTVPIQKYTNAVDLTVNFGRGTPPDYPVNLTLDQWISKEDVVLDYAFKLIKEK